MGVATIPLSSNATSCRLTVLLKSFSKHKICTPSPIDGRLYDYHQFSISDKNGEVSFEEFTRYVAAISLLEDNVAEEVPPATPISAK